MSGTSVTVPLHGSGGSFGGGSEVHAATARTKAHFTP
jgi:hypothetical protein